MLRTRTHIFKRKLSLTRPMGQVKVDTVMMYGDGDQASVRLVSPHEQDLKKIGYLELNLTCCFISILFAMSDERF